jgi:hypothetical protein
MKYPATEESIKRQRLRGLQTVYEWENKNTKRAIYNKDTLNATVDYEAAADLKEEPYAATRHRHAYNETINNGLTLWGIFFATFSKQQPILKP